MTGQVVQLEMPLPPRKPVRASVIPWEIGEYGVAVDWSDGFSECYSVGTQEAAKTEARRLRSLSSHAADGEDIG